MALKTIMECDICGKEKEGKYLIADITRKEHNPDVIKLAETYCDTAYATSASSLVEQRTLSVREKVYICEECEAKIKAFCKSIKDGEPEPTMVYDCSTCKRDEARRWSTACTTCTATKDGIPSRWQRKEK